jgi:SAM-dependent methyltransferase
MPKGEGVQVSTLDGKISHDGSPIDFETDTLPYEDRTFDVVLMYNVLEHIYNYHHLLVEARRVVKPDGVLFGFVPFLQRYHPDPHDYFRYTHEALQKMLRDAGYDAVVVKPIGLGMFSAQFQTMALSLPRLARVILYPCYHSMDLVYTNLRSHTAGWYPLGYYFQARCLGNTGIMNTLK